MTEYLRNRGCEEENEGFFCRFTFGQFFALLVIEVFTLFFIFYLGARYGPEFLGFEKRGAVVVGEVPSGAKVSTTADAEVAAMAKDLVDKARTPELKERLSEMLKRAPEGKVEPPANVGREVSEAPSEVPVDESAPKEGAGQLPMGQYQQSAEVEKGAVRIKAAENAKYALQVGSYQQLTDANVSIDKWKRKGYSTYLMIADIPDRGRWYRVRIGGFATREEAKQYQKEFETQEKTPAFVVMNEQ